MYREEACTVLEKLPGILDNQEGYIKITTEDEKLHRLTELY